MTLATRLNGKTATETIAAMTAASCVPRPACVCFGTTACPLPLTRYTALSAIYQRGPMPIHRRFYNPRRRHSTLGYMSPAEFEEKAMLAYIVSIKPAAGQSLYFCSYIFNI